MAGAALNRSWLVGRRFFDEGEEYEVLRVGRKRWKKPAIDVREAETGNSALIVQCNCVLCLQPLGTSLRARASGVQCFVGASVTIGDDLLFVCGDRCVKQPLLNQSRMMK